MEDETGRDKLGQLGKIMRERSGSIGMVEDMVKRKREEIEGAGGDEEGGGNIWDFS